MMGQQPRMESLFYYFRLEDQIPENHLLRLIDRHVDLSFVRERVKSLYSSTGRPSIDPEVLLRLLLVGYLYGITSERRLVEEVRMHLAYRWFTRLDLNQEVPDHSTFSKNRHGRFRQSGVFREVFEEIVQRCLAAGLVEGKTLAVDGTLVAAGVCARSRIYTGTGSERLQVRRISPYPRPIRGKVIFRVRWRGKPPNRHLFSVLNRLFLRRPTNCGTSRVYANWAFSCGERFRIRMLSKLLVIRGSRYTQDTFGKGDIAKPSTAVGWPAIGRALGVETWLLRGLCGCQPTTIARR